MGGDRCSRLGAGWRGTLRGGAVGPMPDLTPATAGSGGEPARVRDPGPGFA